MILHSQTTIQQELEKLAKIIRGNLILKIKYFLSKLEIFTKLRKKNCISTVVSLVIKMRKNIQLIHQEMILQEMLIYYL